MVTHQTVQVDGLNVFYREAGDPATPKLLLLGGFHASSHQFRNLIPALADRFHVLSPDYPGFGNSDMPEEFEYTFDRLSEIVEGLLEQTGFYPFGLYHQDYGGPIGNRIVGRHPDWLEWRVSPDNWNMDLHFLERPNARKVQVDLLYDYRTNVDLYPQWQAFLRERQPKTIILWGENDIFFTPEGGRAYLRDLPDAELHMLDSGHFAVEDTLEEIVAHIKRFHAEQIVGRASTAAPAGTR